MLVKVNTSLAGADFNYRFGQEVEQDVFSAHVGNGWKSLCDPVANPVVEKADAPDPEEVAVVEPAAEVADAVPAAENTSKRGRRK